MGIKLNYSSRNPSGEDANGDDAKTKSLKTRLTSSLKSKFFRRVKSLGRLSGTQKCDTRVRHAYSRSTQISNAAPRHK